MAEGYRYIDPDLISKLVYHDKAFIKEFAEATEHSFDEFRKNYRKFLLERDEVNFRKAGHKIKPVVQMLNIDEVVEEYEQAKMLIWENRAQKLLEESADTIEKICTKIIRELRTLH